MKATDLLSKHHREAEKLLGRLADGKGDGRALAEELARKLLAHMIIEQTQFYPAVAKVDEDLVLEAFEEHAVARYEIRRLRDSDEGRFEARATTLKELIEHHVKEEEDELFPKVERALGAEALAALGESMEALFEVLQAEEVDVLLERSRRTGEDGSRNAAA